MIRTERTPPRIRTEPPKLELSYRLLWSIVDGCVADVFHCHPDYLATNRRRAAQNSVTKRVVGAVHAFAVKAAKGRSLVSARAADKAEAHENASAPGVSLSTGGQCNVGRVRGSAGVGTSTPAGSGDGL